MQWVIVMPRTKSKEKMILISVHIPEQLLAELDGNNSASAEDKTTAISAG